MYIYKLYYNLLLSYCFFTFSNLFLQIQLLDNPNLSLPDVEIQLLVNPNLS